MEGWIFLPFIFGSPTSPPQTVLRTRIVPIDPLSPTTSAMAWAAFRSSASINGGFSYWGLVAPAPAQG
ncbi:MAG: hypothetical protein HYV63_34115 [Candidatus Schekmanbacteria bacterium]|nr:hypothetical protein [Candidatus Schekmanbacteria bacterium]